MTLELPELATLTEYIKKLTKQVESLANERNSEILTIEQFEERYSVKKYTVRKWREQGAPFYGVPGSSSVFVNLSDFWKWLERENINFDKR